MTAKGRVPEAGMEITQNKPSLTPEEIWRLSDQFREASAPFYALWYLCTQAVTGWRNSVQSDMATRTADTSDLKHFLRPRDINPNLVQPLYKNAISRLAVEEPWAGVLPATAGIDDLSKAEASGAWIRYHWQDAECSDQIAKATEWACVRGTSVMLTRNANGKIRQEPFGPDRLRMEPGLCDPDASRFLAVTRLTTKDALRRQFLDAKQPIRPGETDEDYWNRHDRVERAINGAPSPVVFNTASPQFLGELPSGYCEVLEAYCRSGHWYLILNGEALDQGVTADGIVPIEVLRYTRVPDELWGMGMVEMALAPQYAYTACLNQILRNARLMSNPKVLIDRASKVDPNAFTSAIGEKVFYNGKAPVPWTPPALPAYMQQLPASLQSLMFDTTGIHGVTTGKRTVGITSGRAVDAMTQNDTASLGQTKNAIAKLVRNMAKNALVYLRAYTSEDTAYRQLDQFGGAALRMLKATDIVENPEVWIVADTLFADDAAAREAKILDEVRLGIRDPEDAKKMLRHRLSPMDNLRLVADVAHAQEALGVVIDQGWMVPDPKALPVPDPQAPPVFDAATQSLVPDPNAPVVANPAAPLVQSVQLYPTDNFKVFVDVVSDFMRGPDFDQLDPQRQEDVNQFYLYVLEMASAANPATALPNPKSGGGGANKLPAPEPESSPATGGMDATQAASAQVDVAEATDEFTQ